MLQRPTSPSCLPPPPPGAGASSQSILPAAAAAAAISTPATKTINGALAPSDGRFLDTASVGEHQQQQQEEKQRQQEDEEEELSGDSSIASTEVGGSTAAVGPSRPVDGALTVPTGDSTPAKGDAALSATESPRAGPIGPLMAVQAKGCRLTNSQLDAPGSRQAYHQKQQSGNHNWEQRQQQEWHQAEQSNREVAMAASIEESLSSRYMAPPPLPPPSALGAAVILRVLQSPWLCREIASYI